MLANREGEHTNLQRGHQRMHHMKNNNKIPAERAKQCSENNLLDGNKVTVMWLYDKTRIRLASQSTHKTVSNTRLQWKSCQTADYSFMTAAVVREPDSSGYQNKYWWGCEMGGGKKGWQWEPDWSKDTNHVSTGCNFIGSDDKVAN